MYFSGLVPTGFAIAVLALILIPSALLLLGARIAKIHNRSFSKAIIITFLSAILIYFLTYALKLNPVLDELIRFFGGLLIMALLMTPMFKTTFRRALGAAALGQVFSFVVIGIPVLIAAFFIPVYMKASTRAAMTQAVSNGHNIYLCAFANQINSSVSGNDGNLPFPAVGQYRSSTDFFKDLVESGAMNVSYDFFAARGIPPAKTTDPAEFNAENNAWCMVLGLEDAPEGTPFLFTRNVDLNALQSGESPMELADRLPFGKLGLVIVAKDGSAFSLSGEAAAQFLADFTANCATNPNLEIIGP